MSHADVRVLVLHAKRIILLATVNKCFSTIFVPPNKKVAGGGSARISPSKKSIPTAHQRYAHVIVHSKIGASIKNRPFPKPNRVAIGQFSGEIQRMCVHRQAVSAVRKTVAQPIIAAHRTRDCRTIAPMNFTQPISVNYHHIGFDCHCEPRIAQATQNPAICFQKSV